MPVVCSPTSCSQNSKIGNCRCFAEQKCTNVRAASAPQLYFCIQAILLLAVADEATANIRLILRCIVCRKRAWCSYTFWQAVHKFLSHIKALIKPFFFSVSFVERVNLCLSFVHRQCNSRIISITLLHWVFVFWYSVNCLTAGEWGTNWDIFSPRTESGWAGPANLSLLQQTPFTVSETG